MPGETPSHHDAGYIRDKNVSFDVRNRSPGHHLQLALRIPHVGVRHHLTSYLLTSLMSLLHQYDLLRSWFRLLGIPVLGPHHAYLGRLCTRPGDVLRIMDGMGGLGLTRRPVAEFDEPEGEEGILAPCDT
jgi:hypothetical protein